MIPRWRVDDASVSALTTQGPPTTTNGPGFIWVGRTAAVTSTAPRLYSPFLKLLRQEGVPGWSLSRGSTFFGASRLPVGFTQWILIGFVQALDFDAIET